MIGTASFYLVSRRPPTKSLHLPLNIPTHLPTILSLHRHSPFDQLFLFTSSRLFVHLEYGAESQEEKTRRPIRLGSSFLACLSKTSPRIPRRQTYSCPFWPFRVSIARQIPSLSLGFRLISIQPRSVKGASRSPSRGSVFSNCSAGDSFRTQTRSARSKGLATQYGR